MADDTKKAPDNKGLPPKTDPAQPSGQAAGPGVRNDVKEAFAKRMAEAKAKAAGQTPANPAAASQSSEASNASGVRSDVKDAFAKKMAEARAKAASQTAGAASPKPGGEAPTSAATSPPSGEPLANAPGVRSDVKDAFAKKMAEARAKASGTAPAGAAAGPAPTQTFGSSMASVTLSPEANLDEGFISQKVQIIFIAPYNETVAKLKEKFAADENAKVYEANAASAPNMARQLIPCLLIGSISHNNDVIKQLTMLRALTQEVRKNNVKCIMLSKIKNAAIIKSFEDYGCHEYILEPINDRSLKFKIDLQTKAIAGLRKTRRRQEMAKAEAAKSGKSQDEVVLKSGQNPSENGEGDPSGKKKTDGEAAAGDSWVFKGNKVKKQGPKWTMRMKGPDPSQGEWVETKKDGDGESQWRFVEKEGDPNAPKKKGEVEWTGEKPEFKNGEWEFSGTKPKLAVVDENGKEIESKVSSDKDGLNIGKESKLPSWKVKEKFQNEDEEKKKDEKDGKVDIDFGASEDPSKPGLAGMAMDFEEKPEAYADKVGDDEKAAVGGKNDAKTEKLENGKWQGHDLTPDELNKGELLGGDLEAEAAKKKSGGKGLVGGGEAEEKDAKKSAKIEIDFGAVEEGEDSALSDMAMDFEENPSNYGDKTDEGEESAIGGKNNAKTEKIENRKWQGHDLTPEELMSAEEKKNRDEALEGQDPLARKAKKDGKLEANADDGDDALAAKKKHGKGGDGEGEGSDNSALAGMAMDFEENPDAYGDETENKGKAAVGGKDNAKTEKIENSEWQGHDLTPDELMSEEQKKKRAEGLQGAEGKGKKKKKSGEGEADSDGDEDEKGDVAVDGFAMGDESEKKDTDDFTDAKDGPTGSSQLFDDADEKAGTKWDGRDSADPEEEEGADKLVEIDAVNGSLKVKESEKEEVYEYPAEHFGDPTGTWEPVGREGRAADGRKMYIFVVPAVRLDPTFELKTVPVWWIARVEAKPLFIGAGRKWAFKRHKPEKVEGFGALPGPAREYLISICPKARAEKRAEDAAAAKAEQEEKKKAKQDAASEAAKKAIEEAVAKAKKAKEDANEDAEGKTGKNDESSRGDDAEDAEASGKSRRGGAGDESSEGASSKRRKGDKGKKDGGAKDGDDEDTEGAAADDDDSSSEKTQRGQEDDSEGQKKSGSRNADGDQDDAAGSSADTKKKRRNDENDKNATNKKQKGSKGVVDSDDLDDDIAAKAKQSADGKESAADDDEKHGDELDGQDAERHSKKQGIGSDEDDERPQSGKSKSAAGAAKLPSSPMLAVVLSEMLMFCKGDVQEALDRYCLFLEKATGGAQVTIYSLAGGMKGRVIASSDAGAMPRGSEHDFASDVAARHAIERRSVGESEGLDEIYCPVLALASDGNVTKTGSQPLGILVVKPSSSKELLKGRGAYLQGVAQGLRGALVFLGPVIWGKRGDAA